MYRLIYKSRSTNPISWDLVDVIIETSKRLNARHGVTGVLLATKSHFLQVLEGSFDDVNDVFSRINRDTRVSPVPRIGYSQTGRCTVSGYLT